MLYKASETIEERLKTLRGVYVYKIVLFVLAVALIAYVAIKDPAKKY
ncbi:MAG: hypothetical protein HVN35_02565 [Methanobacteriaceae archaeon]|nr:hypothetical protein [Methanobacteriaceae archaeon]